MNEDFNSTFEQDIQISRGIFLLYRAGILKIASNEMQDCKIKFEVMKIEIRKSWRQRKEGEEETEICCPIKSFFFLSLIFFLSSYLLPSWQL
jgi:hypothetical protein